MDGPDKGGADWQQQQELEEYMQWMDEHRHEEGKAESKPARPGPMEGDCPF